MDSKKDTNIAFNSGEIRNNAVFKLFEKDNHFLFIYKKLERVVSALYLVTNFLSDNEPMKWEFRTVGTRMLSKILSSTLSPLSKAESAHKLSTDMVSLLSLLDVSCVANLISEMNSALLKKELQHLLEILDVGGISQSGQAGQKAVFDKEFFSVPG
jgi:hypothetical protein